MLFKKLVLRLTLRVSVFFPKQSTKMLIFGSKLNGGGRTAPSAIYAVIILLRQNFHSTSAFSCTGKEKMLIRLCDVL